MSDIKESLKRLDELSRQRGELLIEFYETMRKLERHPHRAGMQATKIVMTISDLEDIK